MGKTAKRKGPRKAYLKRFSSATVNSGTGPTPNREVLSDLHHRAANVGKVIYDRNGVRLEDRDPAKIFSEDERLETLWQGDWRQGLSYYNKINLTCGKYGKTELYFRGQSWFFIKEDGIVKTVKRSILYGSRDRAMRAYNMGTICWVERAPLEPTKAPTVGPKLNLERISFKDKAPPG